MDEFFRAFAFCPCCGVQYGSGTFDEESASFGCSQCGYDFYQHSVLSATAVVPSADDCARVLLITRRTAPNCGMLALPGGILRYGEAPSMGAARETLEETNVRATPDRLLCATQIDYPYRGTNINIVELAYVMQPVAIDAAALSTLTSPEASQVRWFDVNQILSASVALAFPEQASVLAAYRATV